MRDRKAAKELVHIRGWLERVDEITQRGERAYLTDALLQEAGDSLMMKLGEARQPVVPARRARARRSRVGRRGCELQLPHPPVVCGLRSLHRYCRECYSLAHDDARRPTP